MAALGRSAIAGRNTLREPATRPPRSNREAMDWNDVPRQGPSPAVYRRRGAAAEAWVTYTEEQAHYAPARWVQRQVEETGKPVALRASSMPMHLEAICAGTGRGVRLGPPIPEIAAEYWIIVHRDLRRAACVRAAIDWVKTLFAEQRDVLAGVA